MTLINLPRRSDIRLPPRRRSRKHRATVIRLQLAPIASNSEADYRRASAIDETDPAAAIPIYEAIIARHDATEARAVTNLGNCYHRQRETEMAEACFHRAVELDASQPEATYNLGYLELERGNAAPALTLLRRATELDPHFSDAWFNRAMAAEQLAGGMCPEARLCFGRYLRSGDTETGWIEIAKERLA